jgi:nanoRNase/pAp phosphatase (c-di-AMP/oligoRNAs hydrolase)
VKMRGSGGGHAHMAAGRIPINGTPVDTVLADFIATIKQVLDVSTAAPNTIL